MTSSAIELPSTKKVGEVEIIHFQPQMKDEIISLWKKNFKNKHEVFIKDFETAASGDQQLFLVAQQYSQVIGTCIGADDGYRHWIYYLCVAKHMRRKNIASKMIKQIEHTLMAKGARSVGLHIFNHNVVAAEFYKKLGYSFEGTQCLSKKLKD